MNTFSEHLGQVLTAPSTKLETLTVWLCVTLGSLMIVGAVIGLISVINGGLPDRTALWWSVVGLSGAVVTLMPALGVVIQVSFRVAKGRLRSGL